MYFLLSSAVAVVLTGGAVAPVGLSSAPTETTAPAWERAADVSTHPGGTSYRLHDRPTVLPESASAAAPPGAADLAALPGADPTGRAGEASRERKVLYLTFDDGPHPDWTPKVLEVLDEYDAEATFFMLGERAKERPGLVKRVRNAGHAIANHTWNHPSLADADRGTLAWQLSSTDRVLGERTRCMRPPYGHLPPGGEAPIRELGYRVVLWDIDPTDWDYPGSRSIFRKITEEARPGQIVLLHDGGGNREQTVEALRMVLDELSEDGWTFESIPYCR